MVSRRGIQPWRGSRILNSMCTLWEKMDTVAAILVYIANCFTTSFTSFTLPTLTCYIFHKSHSLLDSSKTRHSFESLNRCSESQCENRQCNRIAALASSPVKCGGWYWPLQSSILPFKPRHGSPDRYLFLKALPNNPVLEVVAWQSASKHRKDRPSGHTDSQLIVPFGSQNI